MHDDVETTGSLRGSRLVMVSCWIGEMPGNSLYVGF